MSIETRELSTVDGVGRGPTARSISYAPSPYISATNVQAALDTLGVNYALTQSYAQSASASADTATSAASSAQGYATAAAASAGSAATQASSAAASAATATSQASAASASATSADSSKTAAEAAATSAQGYLVSAQASATAAANSETAASGYASAASASATAAAGSASAASTSATNASTSATNAANSASAASTSATNAANSATTATTQAGAASTSAGAAASSATAASTSEANALSYKNSASASASAAATSASDASGYATSASASASAASTSATNASNSATAAAGSATSASGYATNASNSASAASTSATNAANSASAASTSATNAANSATAAQGYATNAATSETNASGYAASAAASAALAASYTLGWTGTSATSVAIGTGSKSFTASTGKLWVAGTPLLISSNANTSNFMFGIVTAYVSGTGALTVNVTAIGGSGTLSDWNISLSGQKGVDGLGTGDVLGPGTNSNGWIPTWNGANSKTLTNGIDPATLLTTAAAAAGYQPLDSDLTAIAALTTAAYGRGLLALSSAANLASEVDPYFLTPAEGNAAYQPLDSDLTAIAALSTTAYGRALLTLASQASLIAEANGAASTSVVYVSKTGSDSNSGLYAGLPKLTIAAAITAAAALITGGVTAAVVKVLDSRQYTEDITLTAGVSLNAPLADLVGAIVVSSGSNVELKDHYAASNSTTMLTTADASGVASIYKSRIMDGRGIGGTLTGVTLFENDSSGRVLVGHIGVQMFVGSGGFGVRDKAGSGFGHVHIITPDLYLAGNNAIAIRSNNANTNIIGYIDHILEAAGNPTGTSGIVIGANGGTVKITASEIVADTVYNINAAGTLYLQCPKQTGAFTGVVTNAGGWVPSAADRILYGTGANVTAETVLTAFGRSIIDDADAATARTTLGLATIASSGSASDLSAGTVPAARMPAHTGDVTSSAGSVALTIGNATVTYAKIQNVSATDKLLGRATAGAGSVEEITCTPFARTILDDADAATARSTIGAQASLGYTPLNAANNLSDVANAATARSNLGVSTSSIVFVIDGGGATITTGVKGDFRVPVNCTINRVTAMADQTGSIVVDIWKDTYANFPPVDADSITASAPVTISSSNKSENSTLTGWSTSLSAGDILRFNVDSVTSIQRLTIELMVTR